MGQPSIHPAAPGRGYDRLRTQIDEAIAEVLNSGWYVLGAACDRFERAFADYLGVAGVVGTASGTDALELALRTLGLGPEDEVLVPAVTASATATAVVRSGARPVLVDVDPDSCTLDPERVAEAVCSATKVILPVHLYGCPAPMERLGSIAREHGLSVVEDCAQSHGARIGDRLTGSFGDVSAFSFYPTKNLPALGDGGCLASDDTGLLERARTLRQYGWQERQVSLELGMNSRLDDIQAAVLGVRLAHLDRDNARRRQVAGRYVEGLSGLNLRLPAVEADHVFHQFCVRHPDRDGLQARLSSAGIGTGVLYPRALHEQPAFSTFRRIPTDLPVSTRICRDVLCLPIYPELTDAEVDRVVSTLRDQSECLRPLACLLCRSSSPVTTTNIRSASW